MIYNGKCFEILPDPTKEVKKYDEDMSEQEQYMRMWRKGLYTLDSLAQKFDSNTTQFLIDQKQGRSIGTMLKDAMQASLSKMALEEMGEVTTPATAKQEDSRDNQDDSNTAASKAVGFEQKLKAATAMSLKFLTETSISKKAESKNSLPLEVIEKEIIPILEEDNDNDKRQYRKKMHGF